jgi:hypothetical protein
MGPNCSTALLRLVAPIGATLFLRSETPITVAVVSPGRQGLVKGTMMNYISASVASGNVGKGLATRPSIRPHFITVGAVASAGILALGLVTAPPDIDNTRTEAHMVHLAAAALPSAAPAGALLTRFINDQAQVVALVAPVVPGGASGITTRDVTNATASVMPLTFQSVTDPAIASQDVGNATLVAIPGATVTEDPATTIVKLILAPIILGVFGLIIVAALIQSYSDNWQRQGAPTPLSQPAPVTLAEASPVEALQATVIDRAASNGRKQDGGTNQVTTSKQDGGTNQATSSKQRASKQDGDTGPATSSKQRASKQDGDTGPATSSKQRDTDQATSQPTKRGNSSAAGHSSAASS